MLKKSSMTEIKRNEDKDLSTGEAETLSLGFVTVSGFNFLHQRLLSLNLNWIQNKSDLVSTVKARSDQP